LQFVSFVLMLLKIQDPFVFRLYTSILVCVEVMSNILWFNACIDFSFSEYIALISIRFDFWLSHV